MTTTPLQIDGLWSYPGVTEIHYLDKCRVFVQLRNRLSGAITLTRASLVFEVEDGSARWAPAVATSQVLLPEQLSEKILIQFEADLGLREYTNRLQLKIDYEDDRRRPCTCTLESPKLFIFNPVGVRDQQFFISHKDPQDTRSAELLRRYLARVGLRGYIAEGEQRPGLDLWETKIPQEIRASLGTIFLWTRHAKRDSTSIIRELELTLKYYRTPILIISDGLQRPRRFPKRFEYWPIQGQLTPRKLREIVHKLYAGYCRGDYATPRATARATRRGSQAPAR